MYAATNPADASLYGHDLFGRHRVHITDGNPNEFEATFHGVLIRDVTLGYLDYSTAVSVDIHSLADNYLVIVPATGTSMLVTAGTTVQCSPVMAAIPVPGKPARLECGPDAAHLVLRIDRFALETHLSRQIGRTVDQTIEFAPAFDLSTGTASRWNFAVQILHAELYAPDSLLHAATGLGPLEEFLMSALLYCQPSNYSEQLDASTRPTSRTVSRAVDFIEQNLAADISVAQVADHAEISVRTLQNQFAKDLQQTPTNYIRNRRLERARTDLADASPTSGASVTSIATRWGFNHLGRFAMLYKSRFGESPSQTLKS